MKETTAGWPVVEVPDCAAQFELTDACVAFPLPAASGSCVDYCEGVAAALGSRVSTGNSAAELLVEGQLVLQLPVGAYGITVGCVQGWYAVYNTALQPCTELQLGPVHASRVCDVTCYVDGA